VIHPLLGSVLLFAALLIPVCLAGRAHPRPPRRRGLDYGAMAEVEENDIDQMIEGINERRRRNGRRDIADELADELLRQTGPSASR
jgi:hypothetical protein